MSSTIDEERRVRFSETIWPAIEKIRSGAALLAGMEKMKRASNESVGNFVCLSDHQERMWTLMAGRASSNDS